MESLHYQHDPRPPTPESATWLLAQGIGLFEAGDSVQAFQVLTEAFAQAPEDAKIRSWYGFLLARTQGCFDEAVALCQAAAKQEFFNPDLYLNLARLYLGFGFKSEGIRYLRRGRMIDPAHKSIAEELDRLGRRSAPVLRFLPRNHLLNRWLGSVRRAFWLSPIPSAVTHRP